MIAERMQRVDKKDPCSICGRPDWCLVAKDGSAAICARIEDGSVKKCGDAGWLHILSDNRCTKQRTFCRGIHVDAGNLETKDFGQLTEECQQGLTADDLGRLSGLLGVSQPSLRRLQVGWDGQAYTFPMKDSDENIIGIRRRFPTGRKVSVKGSKNGLFIPIGLQGDGSLLIVEGGSDLAAALDLGFAGIGRPNCSSKILMTAEAARGRTEIVIVGDNDEVGRAGAEKLSDALVLHYPCVKTVYPPDDIQDLRKWLQAGLTHETLQQIIRDAKPVELAISFKD
ncbi:MAG: hypothetical protein ACYS74_03085 [Planctomycetota bacterium]|jgi:hypothetical protein